MTVLLPTGDASPELTDDGELTRELRRVLLHEYIRQSRARSVVVGSSKDPNAKITVLLFPPDSEVPSLVAKVPRTDVAERAIEREARCLVAFRRLGRHVDLAAVPRLVDVVGFEGRRGVVMTAVPGRSMATRYHAWRHAATRRAVGDDLDAVARWLALFQGQTRGRPAPIEIGVDVPGRLASRFAGHADVDEAVGRVAVVRERLRRTEAPRTAVHGDLWWGNVLLSDGRVSGVVDWEHGAAGAADPVRDLVRFALMYALYLDRHTRPGRRVVGHRALRAGVWGAGVDYALDGRGWFPDAVRGFVRSGLERLGAPASLERDAMLAGIAEVAAETDDAEFATRNLEVFLRIGRRRDWRGHR